MSETAPLFLQDSSAQAEQGARMAFLQDSRQLISSELKYLCITSKCPFSPVFIFWRRQWATLNSQPTMDPFNSTSEDSCSPKENKKKIIDHYEILEVSTKHTDLLSQNPFSPFSLHFTVFILGRFIQNLLKNLLYSNQKMYFLFVL